MTGHCRSQQYLTGGTNRIHREGKGKGRGRRKKEVEGRKFKVERKRRN
jgi:hypothetical protein